MRGADGGVGGGQIDADADDLGQLPGRDRVGPRRRSRPSSGPRPREIIALRRARLGYVSQFLRVVPRVPAREVVAEPLRAVGVPEDEARARAEALLARLNLPEPLWSLSPTTFSGGEQQRVNIARGFIRACPALLLDEPTASLDAANREVVLTLIEEAKAGGAAIVGIFHDEGARARVCDREIDMVRFAPGHAA